MWPKTKFTARYVVVFALIALIHLPALFAQTYLSADGHTDTYSLITSQLAPGANPIEAPDASHPDGAPHIHQIFDSNLGHYVFQFQIHLIQVTPSPIDNDPSTLDTDRQRNEIKTYNVSPEYLKAYAGDTVSFRWKFKLDAGFQPSPKFTHIHQIKPVDGNDSTPVITYLPLVSGSSKVMQLRYYDDSSDNPPPTTLKQVPLAPFLGTWIEANERITFGTHGSYTMSLTRVSDGVVLLSYTNSDINLLRTGASFYRPKWGIYRSVEQYQYLRDEAVLFDNFCLAKGTDNCSTNADFDLSTAPVSQNISAGRDVAYTATVTPNHGFNGTVAMSVSNLPPGTTASFDQQSLLGAGTAQLKLTTTSATTPGTYTVTVTGTSGTLVHSSPIMVQITPTPDFTLSATPPAQSVVAGDNASYTATVTPNNGFSEVVAFGVSGAPTGTTAQFDNDSVTASGSIHLNVSTTASAASGTYPLTITGNGTTQRHTQSVSLVITGAPGFAFGVDPPTQSVVAGDNTSYTATVTPSNGFNDVVAFGVSGVPTGATAQFDADRVTASGTVHLNVSTTASAAPGTYALTITGNSNALRHTQNVSLVIKGRPGFTLGIDPPSQTVSAGRSGTFTATITPSNGFNTGVTFTCAGLPSGAQCLFSPSSVTPSQSQISSTLTITTTAPTMSRLSGRSLWPMLASFIPLILAIPTSVRDNRHAKTLLRLLFVCLMGFTLMSCGGGSAVSKTTSPIPQGGTPAGTYHVTISAVSDTQQHAAIDLTVTR